jgi:GNAT superfamily N-acetyltransferase
MPHLNLPMSVEQFRRLPRNAAYRYRYRDGTAYMTPVAVYYRARLELTPPPPLPPGVLLRGVTGTDQRALPEVFAAAFEHVQPFGSLDAVTRLAAARTALHQTIRDGDGPWIRDASFVAVDAEGAAAGGILITLVPPLGPPGRDRFVWSAPPPPDAVTRRLGRPHVTWVFVRSQRAGQGVGTALLHAAVGRLLAMGFAELVSTFILGNDSSMAWHWRNGFRLLPREQFGE